MNLASREYKKDLNQAYVKFQSRLSGEMREASSHGLFYIHDSLGSYFYE
jgi:hypothetical protein